MTHVAIVAWAARGPEAAVRRAAEAPAAPRAHFNRMYQRRYLLPSYVRDQRDGPRHAPLYPETMVRFND
jgi:hypothetical protein